MPSRTASQPASSDPAGVGRLAGHRDGLHGPVEGVERRRAQAAPQRRPGPGQVGVARGVVLGAVKQCRHRVRRRHGVGDPAVGEDTERVVGDQRRRLTEPPGDDGCVRGQQRQHDRLRVQREPAVHPHDHGLAGSEPAADEHLGVEPRLGRIRTTPYDDEQPAGVLRSSAGGGQFGFGHALLVDDDNQSERQAARHGPGLPALSGQRFDDLGTGRVPQCRHARLRQSVVMLASGEVLSRSPPGPAVAGEHLVGRLRAPLAGAVVLRPEAVGVLLAPQLLDRVDDPPGLLDLLVAREQRRVAEQDVQEQSLVGLRARSR